MANLSESYDKASLVISLILAVGLGAMIWMARGNVEEDFKDSTGRSPAAAPENPKEEFYSKMTSSISGTVTLEGPVTEKGRQIDLTVGTPLFLNPGGEEIDLGDSSYPMVHAPIPNQWWLDNRIDPGWSNSPGLDQDGDGFSNGEEFDAKTDPNDAKSYPALIAKLQCVELLKRAFRLSYSSDSTIGPIKETDTFKFTHEEIIGGRSKRTSSENIPFGKGNDSNLFSEGGAQMRYELKKVEQREFKNPNTGITQKANFAEIEDVAGAKKGDILEIKKGSRNGVILRDYTAVLSLGAIGQEAVTLKVEERSSFALPLDPNAPEKPYKFIGVSDTGAVIIEWEEDGESKTREIQPLSPSE